MKQEEEGARNLSLFVSFCLHVCHEDFSSRFGFRLFSFSIELQAFSCMKSTQSGNQHRKVTEKVKKLTLNLFIRTVYFVGVVGQVQRRKQNKKHERDGQFPENYSHHNAQQLEPPSSPSSKERVLVVDVWERNIGHVLS